MGIIIIGEMFMKNFNDLVQDTNKKIIEGHLELSLVPLEEAVEIYEKDDNIISFPNIFDKASNVIEGFTSRVRLLKALQRVVNAARDQDTRLIYLRYLSLATALYGEPEKGLDLLKTCECEQTNVLVIEMNNIKGLILSKLERDEEALEVYMNNYELIKTYNYVPGYRFVQNIGSVLKKLYRYEEAIKYFKIGIEYDFDIGYEINGIMAMIELADTYVINFKGDLAKRLLKKVMKYDVLTQNQNLYHSYCEVMYKMHKSTGHFEDALFFHEILKELEIQLNMEYYSGILDQYHSQDEHDFISYELMSKKLRNTNKFLQTTLAKSHEVQQQLMAKNQELEATMESLNNTQDRLLVAEKRNVLDSMFINIANHMSTPLGVMNTSTSHIKNITRKTAKKLDMRQLSKTDLLKCIDELEKSVSLYEESMNKVIGFVDTLKLYKTNEEEEVKRVNLETYLNDIAQKYRKYKGIEEVEVICHEDASITINTALFEKCIELISRKLLLNSERNGFDIEVSIESGILSIGVGDFKSQSEVEDVSTSIVDSYDFYIIQTIVENLLNGRFIKFKDRGRDYFQFIFTNES